MNEFTTLERIDILIGNVKGLVNVITRNHEKETVEPLEAWDTYNETRDLTQAIFWYANMLNEAVQELQLSEKFK